MAAPAPSTPPQTSPPVATVVEGGIKFNNKVYEFEAIQGSVTKKINASTYKSPQNLAKINQLFADAINTAYYVNGKRLNDLTNLTFKVDYQYDNNPARAPGETTTKIIKIVAIFPPLAATPPTASQVPQSETLFDSSHTPTPISTPSQNYTESAPTIVDCFRKLVFSLYVERGLNSPAFVDDPAFTSPVNAQTSPPPYCAKPSPSSEHSAESFVQLDPNRKVTKDILQSIIENLPVEERIRFYKYLGGGYNISAWFPEGKYIIGGQKVYEGLLKQTDQSFITELTKKIDEMRQARPEDFPALNYIFEQNNINILNLLLHLAPSDFNFRNLDMGKFRCQLLAFYKQLPENIKDQIITKLILDEKIVGKGACQISTTNGSLEDKISNDFLPTLWGCIFNIPEVKCAIIKSSSQPLPIPTFIPPLNYKNPQPLPSDIPPSPDLEFISKLQSADQPLTMKFIDDFVNAVPSNLTEEEKAFFYLKTDNRKIAIWRESATDRANRIMKDPAADESDKLAIRKAFLQIPSIEYLVKAANGCTPSAKNLPALLYKLEKRAITKEELQILFNALSDTDKEQTRKRIKANVFRGEPDEIKFRLSIPTGPDQNLQMYNDSMLPYLIDAMLANLSIQNSYKFIFMKLPSVPVVPSKPPLPPDINALALQALTAPRPAAPPQPTQNPPPVSVPPPKAATPPATPPHVPMTAATVKPPPKKASPWTDDMAIGGKHSAPTRPRSSSDPSRPPEIPQPKAPPPSLHQPIIPPPPPAPAPVQSPAPKSDVQTLIESIWGSGITPQQVKDFIIALSNQEISALASDRMLRQLRNYLKPKLITPTLAEGITLFRKTLTPILNANADILLDQTQSNPIDYFFSTKFDNNKINAIFGKKLTN